MTRTNGWLIPSKRRGQLSERYLIGREGGSNPLSQANLGIVRSHGIYREDRLDSRSA